MVSGARVFILAAVSTHSSGRFSAERRKAPITTRLPAAIPSSRRVASRLRSSTTGNSSAASPLRRIVIRSGARLSHSA